MTLTATEFKTNFGKYMDLLVETSEELTITRNGHKIAQISKPKMSAVEELAGLLDKIPRTKSCDDIKFDALKEKHEIDM